MVTTTKNKNFIVNEEKPMLYVQAKSKMSKAEKALAKKEKAKSFNTTMAGKGQKKK